MHAEGALKMRRTIDSVVDPLVHSVDFLAQLLGIEIEPRLVLWKDTVEVRVEHAYDLRRLVIHDSVLFLVPEHRDGEAAGEIGVGAEVEVLDVLSLIVGINICIRELVGRSKRPAFGAHTRRDNAEGCGP